MPIVPFFLLQVVVDGYYAKEGKTCLRADSNLYSGEADSQETCGYINFVKNQHIHYSTYVAAYFWLCADLGTERDETLYMHAIVVNAYVFQVSFPSVIIQKRYT